MKYLFCPACGEKTYHRYRCRLRCRFTPVDSWQCLACEKPKPGKKPVSNADEAGTQADP